MKTILVLPVWYPTEDNPMSGSFFKEQIELLSQKYNFIVLKYHRGEAYKSNKAYELTLDREYQVDEDCGVIKEYTATSFESTFTYALERVKSALNARKGRIPGVGIYHSEGYNRMIAAAVNGIAAELSKDEEIALVYGISAMGVAYESYLMAKYLQVPLIFSEHGPFPYPGTTISDTDKLALEAADDFLAISHDKVRQIMLQNIKLSHITYVGNLIDENRFICDRINHEVPTILIVAANSFFKNYDMFFETLEKLNNKTSNPYHVIIAGYNANKSYCDSAESLEKRVKKSSFSDKVELIPAVAREDMSSLYNRADVFVMTSIQEGQPVSALEAACCGLPVFATRCGGVEDYVDESMGRIVDITDSESLSEYLRQYIDKEITFDANHIRQTVVSQFGCEAYLDTIASSFDKS